MLKLTPVLKDYLWGGNKLTAMFGRKGGEKVAESWEVSVHPDGESKCGNKTLSTYLKENPRAVDGAGSPFPVLIKYIDAKQNLSVQVHPNDEYAQKYEGDNGKTETWYIVQADEGAGIYCGFKRDTTREEFLRKVKDGTVEELLNFIPVKSGDCYLIEAGTVHAIGAGCVICEIQQSSNVTYRVYDYNRKDANGNLRPLHVEKAVDVINFRAFEDRTGSGDYQAVSGGKIRLLTECKYFRCRELLLNGKYCEKSLNSFIAVNALEGSGTVNGLSFEKGDSFFIPCGEELVLEGTGKLILTEKHIKKYYGGIDLGGTFVKCGIVDEEGNIIINEKIPTGVERPYGEVIADMANLVKRLAKEADAIIEGVGVGSPGMIDSANGIVVYSNNFGWRNVPLVEELKKYLDVPVKITNDANAAALGESFCGAGKQYRSMVLVTLGTGVGSGIVLDGKLFEGNGSAGAELGHMVIHTGGEQCTCGRRGCLEAYASATALIRQTKRAMENNEKSAMWKLCQGDVASVNGKTAFDGMRAGDPVATKVVEEYIAGLSAGIINIANIFRPEIILLGGGICKEGETLLAPLRKHLAKELFGGEENVPVRLAAATLGNDAGICGSARLVMPNRY